MTEEDFIMRQIKTVGKSLASLVGKNEASIDIIIQEENSDPTRNDDAFPIDYESFEKIKKKPSEWASSNQSLNKAHRIRWAFYHAPQNWRPQGVRHEMTDEFTKAA